jgi:hypothetical protein
MEIEAHVSCRAGFLMSSYMSGYFSGKKGLDDLNAFLCMVYVSISSVMYIFALPPYVIHFPLAHGIVSLLSKFRQKENIPLANVS